MAKLSQPPSLLSRWQANLDDHVIALAWCPDSAQIAAASVSGPITIFDAVTGAVKHHLKGHEFGTTYLSWQPAGRLLASAGQDGRVRLWDASTGTEFAALEVGSPWAERAVWNPAGDALVSAAGKKLRLWNQAGELVRAYPDQAATIADVKWATKGKEFASAGYGGVSFWNLLADEPRMSFPWKGSVLTIAWSPNGKYIAGGAQDCSVHFWFAKSGKDLEMTGYPRKVGELSWDSSSTFLATGGSQLITVWKCSEKGPAGSTPLTFEFHEHPLSGLAFQKRGPLLASACTGGLFALWYPGGSKKALAQAKLESGISTLQWALNDRQLAVGAESGLVRVWTV